MNNTIEFAVRAVVMGAAATALMDLWAAVLRRFGVSSLDFALLGRWLGHLPRGRFLHENIRSSSPVEGERILGWAAHYSIGITFAALLLALFGLEWARRPTVGPALLVGLVTVVAPLFLLQPALGFGIASTRTATPLFNAAKSVVTHLVFGVGLYASATLLRLVK